ncbi:MAG: hypothetical protein RL292_84 [Candidatus Parcubacteria bacterium]|jgi:hypothetical protein
MSKQLIALMAATVLDTNQKILRRAAEKKQREEEAQQLKVLEDASAYLIHACDTSTPDTKLSTKEFTGAIRGLLSLGALCGAEEKLLMQMAVMQRPTFLHFSAVSQYFRETKDLKVAEMYLQRILDQPLTDERLPEDHPIIFAAKAALAIAVEVHGTNDKPMKQYAQMLIDRFPGMPGDDDKMSFKARLQRIACYGIYSNEPVKTASPAPKPGIKALPMKVAQPPKAPVVQAQARVLPGVTASLKDFASNNAAARAKANKKKKKAA